MKTVLLMMDLGTLNKMRDIDRESRYLKEFRGKKLILTGWDFKGHGRLAAEKYDADAIVCESSILYIRPTEGWNGAEPKKVCLFEQPEIDKVKHANSEVMSQIFRLDKDAVFYSQGNEVGICYYINPPRRTLEKLTRFAQEKPVGGKEFRDYFCDFGINSDEVTATDLKLQVRDTTDNRYYVEKVNARHRTFRPYRVRLENKLVTVELDAQQEKEFKYEDVEKIVDETWLEGRGKISLEEYFRIVPQDDICIDIFPRTKRESWREALKEAGMEDVEQIFYISAKTQSDIPFIVNGYHEKGFYALGPADMPDGLKRAGVIPGANTITDALDFVRKHI